MKKITVILSLLVTAILCFLLASCESKKPSAQESTNASTAATENSTVESISSAGATTHESTHTSVNSTAVSETATATKPATTKPSTTAPTTKPTSTQAPTTTQPTTTVPTTTQPVITTQSETTTTVISDGEDTDLETVIIKSVNAERAKLGLSKLSYSLELSEAANVRAKEISQNYGHIRPDGSLSLSISPSAMGENIAKGQTSPQEVMAAWMSSEGHRGNILAKAYKTIGVGCYYDSATDTYYWVQLFGN